MGAHPHLHFYTSYGKSEIILKDILQTEKKVQMGYLRAVSLK